MHFLKMGVMEGKGEGWKKGWRKEGGEKQLLGGTVVSVLLIISGSYSNPNQTGEFKELPLRVFLPFPLPLPLPLPPEIGRAHV